MARDARSVETPKTPQTHSEKVVAAAEEATATWLKDAGKIAHAHELDVTKKFSDYGVSSGEFSELSKVVVGHVRRSTGKELELPADAPERFHHAPVRDFIRALPGRPTIPSSGPLRSAVNPLAGRPNTDSSGPLGRGRNKSGGK